jgi:glutamate N-acetyltransferase/amino-acid N-acetyltransferase
VSDRPAVSAGVFTRNLFQAAPVRVGKALVRGNDTARAVLINAGQANACTGEEGLRNCRRTQELLARATGLRPEDILPASTGVIGDQLVMDAWERVAPTLAANLGAAGLEDFASAIMTTDAFPKFCGERLEMSGGTVTLVGAAKGAGMICPNMATMLSVVLCDADIDVADWRAMFARVTDQTFNRATVDGDTSTNDTLYGLANGASGVRVAGDDLGLLEQALRSVLADLAYKLVQDGEGGTKVLHIHVSGARTNAQAEQVARTVGHSQLVKTAMYGKDANWGRIAAAVGRAGVDCDPARVTIFLCGEKVFAHEQPTGENLDALLKQALEERDIPIDIVLGDGPGEYRLWASDLGHEYVDVNAAYRS